MVRNPTRSGSLVKKTINVWCINQKNGSVFFNKIRIKTMYAETVYTVFNSLSQVEKERFIDIIQQEIKALQQPSKPKKEKKSRVKSKEEYMDVALQLMSSRKRNANKK